jgi:hypothetical protein
MKTFRITSTTNGAFLGHEFNDAFPIILPNGSLFIPDSVSILPSGESRFSTSNFIIDAKEV